MKSEQSNGRLRLPPTGARRHSIVAHLDELVDTFDEDAPIVRRIPGWSCGPYAPNQVALPPESVSAMIFLASKSAWLSVQ